jgi:hypothetical protein
MSLLVPSPAPDTPLSGGAFGRAGVKSRLTAKLRQPQDSKRQVNTVLPCPQDFEQRCRQVGLPTDLFPQSQKSRPFPAPIPARPAITLVTDSPDPSGVGEHMMTLAMALRDEGESV